MSAHEVGDQVTVLPPYDDDPYILRFQRYGLVAAVLDGPAYLVTLRGTMPASMQFGPFPAQRLAPGWRDANDQWRVP